MDLVYRSAGGVWPSGCRSIKPANVWHGVEFRLFMKQISSSFQEITGNKSGFVAGNCEVSCSVKQ